MKNIGNSVLGFFGMSLDNFKLEKGANGGYSISTKQWYWNCLIKEKTGKRYYWRKINIQNYR